MEARRIVSVRVERPRPVTTVTTITSTTVVHTPRVLMVATRTMVLVHTVV